MAYSELGAFCKTPAGAPLAARLAAAAGDVIRRSDDSRLRSVWREGSLDEVLAMCKFYAERPKTGAWLLPTLADLRVIYEDCDKFKACAAVFGYAYNLDVLADSTPHLGVLAAFFERYKKKELAPALASFAARGLLQHVEACLDAGVPPAPEAFEAAAAAETLRLDVLDRLNRRGAARAAELRGAVFGGHLGHVEHLLRRGARFAPGMFRVRSGDLAAYRRLVELGCPPGGECLATCESVEDARALRAMGGWGPGLDALFRCGRPEVLEFARALIEDGAPFDAASISRADRLYWPKAHREFYAWLCEKK
jgi:hypothetical protein